MVESVLVALVRPFGKIRLEKFSGIALREKKYLISLYLAADE